MKLFWCEQSGLLEDRDSIRSAVESSGGSFLRFNWKYGARDPDANVHCERNLSWSKGRELLFSRAIETCEDDDFIIFADDDIVFANGTWETNIQALHDELDALNPTCACIHSNNHHMSTLQHKIVKRLGIKRYRIFLADLELQIFRADFAKIVFPCIYDGGWGTLWYPFIANNNASSGGTTCLSFSGITNTRTNASGEYGGELNKASHKIWMDSEPILPLWVRGLYRLTDQRRTIVFSNAIYFIASLVNTRQKQAGFELDRLSVEVAQLRNIAKRN